MFRDQDGKIAGGTIPAGSTWTGSGSVLSYSDPAGTNGGIVSITIRPAPLAPAYRVQVRMRTGLASAANARTGTAVFRVGDDCWSDTTPCNARGSNVTCKGRAQP